MLAPQLVFEETPEGSGADVDHERDVIHVDEPGDRAEVEHHTAVQGNAAARHAAA